MMMIECHEACDMAN